MRQTTQPLNSGYVLTVRNPAIGETKEWNEDKDGTLTRPAT